MLADEEYRRLQMALMLRPELGDLIQGSGGLRKPRRNLSDAGKRGGLRIVYYWDRPSTIYMLPIYKKTGRDDMSKEQVAVLKRLVKEWLQ